ncbi:MAG: cation diffusion facilitator family transporter [Steroidobacteraceae bacterium]
MKPTRRMALLSIATSIATLALKFGAWGITGSVSLLSDALEALVNLAAGLVALGALTVAEQPADDRHAYGHDKAEYFSSGVEGTLILFAAASIIYAAIGRLRAPAELQHLALGIGVAALAALLNFVTSRVMLRTALQHDSITIEADAHHLMTDVFTSGGVILGLLVVMFAPQLRWLDPLVAILVGLHIIWTGFGLLRRSVDGLMDASLSAEDVEAARNAISSRLPEGTAYDALRTRKAGPRRFVELKLYVPGAWNVDAAHAACDRIESALRDALPNCTATIHVEPRRDAVAQERAP